MTELYRTNALEISSGWDFSYQVMQYHDRYTLVVSLVYCTFYIKLPCFGYDFDNWDRSWGFYWHERSFWIRWGNKSFCLYAPWSWDHVRHEVMFPDGLKKPPDEPWEKDDGRLIEEHPYTYVLRNGEIQHRVATVFIEEREWRWRWFKWLPWPRIIRRCIDVSFDDEVGERTGSWKGGVLGCGYELLPGETMGACLKRMEKEKVFD